MIRDVAVELVGSGPELPEVELGRFTRREAQDLLRVAERMDEEAINGLRRNVNRGGPDAQLFGRRAKR